MALRIRTTALTGALVTGLVLAAAGCGGAQDPGGRVLLIGWDGATFDLLDPMVAAGELPNLAALVAEGRTATMASTKVPISSAAWPTMTTGRTPGEHGVYSFFRRDDPETYDVRLVSARDIDAPPIWRTLDRRGHVVQVWGVPLTFPPEPVHGKIVAGMLSPFDAAYAYPPEYTQTLRDAGFVPDVGIWQEERGAGVDEIHRMLDVKERMLLAELERPDWSFAMVVFKSLDVLCHNPQTDLQGAETRALLVRLDEILGKLRAAAGEDATTMLVSDHGFTTYRRTFNLHRWLIESGYSVPDADATVEAPTTGPLAVFRASERRHRLGQLQLDATRAYAEVCEGNFGSIRFNVKGREPNGALDPTGVDELARAIEGDLAKLEFPQGVPFVQKVHRVAEMYPGPHRDRVLPDLVVELTPEFRCVAATFGQTQSVGHAPFPDHALDGIFVMAGPDVEPSGERTSVELVDVAPIVFHAMGEAVPSNLSGSARSEFLTSGRAAVRIDAAKDESLVATEAVYRGMEDVAASNDVTDRVKGSGYAD